MALAKCLKTEKRLRKRTSPKKTMNITRLITALAIMITMILLVLFFLSRSDQEPIPVMEGVSLALDVPGHKLTYEGEEDAAFSHDFATETRHHWNVAMDGEEEPGQLILAIRTIEGGDVMLFTRMINPSPVEAAVHVRLHVDGVSDMDASLYPDDDFEREHDPTLGVDPTSYPSGLFDLTASDDHRFSLMLGKNHVSRERTEIYDDGARSRLRELVDELEDYQWSAAEDGLILTHSLKSEGEDLSEQWLLLSEEPLFEDGEHLNDWQAHAREHYKQVNKWYTQDGPYRKLPFSIEPYTELGYGRNLGTMREQRMLDWHRATGERYFHTMILNSLTDLFQYRGEDEQVWKTEYTSTWLKNQWGTRAPFVDTRHNESIARFFIDLANHLGQPDLKEEAGYYARFLREQVEEGQTIDLGDGHHYIADYNGVYDEGLTHASLNHILGELNFLLMHYREQGEREDLELALKLRDAVSYMEEEWIRDNGDLWYQINPDLSFDGNDYPLLTLQDLLESQQLLMEAGQEPSPAFERLIASKSRYLRDADIPLNDDIISLMEELQMGLR